MNRILAVIMAAALLPCLYSSAIAVEFTGKGAWQWLFEHSNVTPRGKNGQDALGALQRLRIQLDATVNEQLSGTVQFELGRTEWGQAASGGALGADANMVEVRLAYIDFVVPQSEAKIRMGLQTLMLPGFVSGFSPIFCHDMAGITVSKPLISNEELDMTATLFWARPYNDNAEKVFPEKNVAYLDNMDVFALTLPMRAGNLQVTPWGMYALIGKYSLSGLKVTNEPAIVAPRGGLMPILGNNTTYPGFQGQWLSGLDRAWGEGIWAGITTAYTFDDTLLAADFVYGGVNMGTIANYRGFEPDAAGKNFDVRRAGWYAGLRMEQSFDWGKPGLILWYGSGDDDNPYNGSERLPQYNTPWPVTSLGFGGSHIDEAAWKVLGSSPGGLAGVVAQLKDISFVDNLTHTIKAAYFLGTNSPQMPRKAHMSYPTRADGPHVYLTTTDSAWEVNLINELKIYENLTLNVEAGYVQLHLDSDTWRGVQSSQYKDNYRVSALFTYSF